jgi:DNA-binding GntR family transcriptional regulator
LNANKISIIVLLLKPRSWRSAGSETLAVSGYEQLRSAVMNGRQKPGERLKPVEFAARLQVGLGSSGRPFAASSHV